MKSTIETAWQERMTFISQVGENQVVTDAPVEAGGDGKGASPKKLMMVALAGCTGVDVVEILKKMRVKVERFSITIEATLTESVPAVYSAMHIIYSFTGPDLDPKKLQRAVELSQQKYCGVSMMYKQIMDITWEIRIAG